MQRSYSSSSWMFPGLQPSHSSLVLGLLTIQPLFATSHSLQPACRVPSPKNLPSCRLWLSVLVIYSSSFCIASLSVYVCKVSAGRLAGFSSLSRLLAVACSCFVARLSLFALQMWFVEINSLWFSRFVGFSSLRRLTCCFFFSANWSRSNSLQS